MNRADETLQDGPNVDAPQASRGFLGILWQRKALVLLGLVLGLIGGALFYWQRPPVYQAYTQLLIIKKNQTPIRMTDGDPRLAMVEDYMTTHLVLLRSPLIIERAVKKKDLISLKTFENSGDPVGQIGAGLTVGRDLKEGGAANSVLNLSFRGPVADECGKILSAVVESYQDFLDVTYRNVSDQTLDLITKARDMLKKDLAESEKKYQEFKQRNSLFWKNKDGIPVQLDLVISLESKRSALLIRKTELEERIRFLNEAVSKGDGADAVQSLLRGQDAKAAAAEKALDDNLLPLIIQERKLRERYGEDYPEVVSLRNSMTVVREHHQKGGALGGEADPVKRLVKTLDAELRETVMIVQSLGRHLETAKADAKDLTNHEIQEDHLRNEVARTQQLYEGTIKRLTEINLVRESGGFDARTLSQTASGIKIAPNALQTIVGGLLLGLLAGIGLAYLADLTDKSFRNPDEVRRRLGLPVLGHIPYMQPDADSLQRVQAGAVTVDPLLLALHRPKSLDAEVYRAVRTALYFSVQGEGHRVLQVTSPNKGDGKSLMVANLAVSMAQSGKKVLVIDADCRRPRQHKIFNLPNTEGLTTVITQRIAWKDAVHSGAGVEGFSIMPSGPIPHNPSELLSSPRFHELLETVRPEFDYVIVDTPPLLAVTDPCVVADNVDGLVLVLRLTRQGRPHAERAREILLSLGVKILGVVVNGVARQGGAGIYNSEHYDYTESYEESTAHDDEDGYYYNEDDNATVVTKK